MKLSDPSIVQIWPRNRLRPSPENDKLYRPVNRTSDAHQDLVASIREQGILDPLVITADGWIVSGHRRYAACVDARVVKVPVRVLTTQRADYGDDEWIALLREHNRQRVKTFDESLRETLADANPEVAYQALLEHRKFRPKSKLGLVPVRDEKRRCEISEAKEEFAGAIVKIIETMTIQGFLPVSLRRIHYLLLNTPPLIHSSKPDSRYRNEPKCYKALCDLAIRMRFEERIAWEDICDDTRPQSIWMTHPDCSTFIKSEMNDLFANYQRDLLQSQPDHIELVVEKNTVEGVLSNVAARYCLPLTSGRGYCSGRPRWDMAERYFDSGKDRLVLLLVSDHDPDGNEISHSFARSMRDEFNIPEVVAYRLALTPDQVRQFNLVPGGKAKPGASTYARYVREHGDNIYELEALPPADLQSEIIRGIESVLDVSLLNREIAEEKSEAAQLSARKAAILKTIEEANP